MAAIALRAHPTRLLHAWQGNVAEGPPTPPGDIVAVKPPQLLLELCIAIGPCIGSWLELPAGDEGEALSLARHGHGPLAVVGQRDLAA